MADNFLITGYWGEPHITAENDRGINAATFGKGRFVLPVGEQFHAEYIGNNTIRMYDGKLLDNGAAAGIPAGEFVDLLIANAGQGMKRNDLIVFQYEQDGSTLIESGKFVVVQGTETSGTASDPALTQQDLLSGEATYDQFALWRVPVSGTAISAPVKLFEISQNIKTLSPVIFEITANGEDVTFRNEKTVSELFDLLESNMPVEIRYFLTSSSYIVLNSIRKTVLPIGSGTAYQIEGTSSLSTLQLTVTSGSASIISFGLSDAFTDAFTDYVEEQGTSGYWKYRKWHSDNAECWGVFQTNYSTKMAEGGNYAVTSDVIRVDLPPNLFSKTPVVALTLMGGGYPSVNIANIYKDYFTISIRTEWAVTDMQMWLQIYCIN